MENMNNFFENNQNDENQEPDFIDILHMPVGKAFVELGKLGFRAVRNLKQSAQESFQEMADKEYAKMCHSELTMDDCLAWLKLQKSAYPQAMYFFIHVEQNPSPRNENDLLAVTIALVDVQKKAIPITAPKKSGFFASSVRQQKNQDLVCMVIPTRTLDIKLLKALNGGSSVLIRV